jgi:thioredoxin reductase
MTTHENDTGGFVRWVEVAVIGGSAAGLAGALMLARSRRSVIVVDAGEPRNAPAAHMHGYLGYEGRSPQELIAAGRDEVRSYGVEVLVGRVGSVERGDDGRFRVGMPGGTLSARAVLVATGSIDELPELDGLADHWGTQVIHCPYCHGWEVRDQRIVVLATSSWASHQTGLFRQLSDDVTVIVHDPEQVDDDVRQGCLATGAVLIEGPAHRVVATGGKVAGIELADGQTVGADAVVVATRVVARGDFLAPLGIAPVEHPSGTGTVIEVDAMGATSVSGVYAAGNVTDPSMQVLTAAAHGGRVGALINARLVEADHRDDAVEIANEWDRRYGSADQMWSGNPNGTLVAEVTSLEPGRALDVGCGEGGDAVWLAEQGWTVTALDVTQVALDRVARAGADRGLAIATVCSDLPRAGLPPGSFDLVSLQYPAIPRTPEGGALNALLAAVAPGGTLLVVGHDLDDMRAHTHGEAAEHVRPFDALAFVQPHDVANALGAEEWVVEVNEIRDRPPGHVHGSGHVRDVVVRARRISQG